MLNLIKQVFADRLASPAWQAKLREIVPSYGVKLNDDPQLLAHEWNATAETLAARHSLARRACHHDAAPGGDARQGRSPPPIWRTDP